MGRLVFMIALLITLTTAIHPGKIMNRNATDIIPNSYIVVYNNNVSDSAINTHESSINSLIGKRDKSFRGILRRYNISAFKGYHIEADEESVANIAAALEVAYIQLDTQLYPSILKTQKNAEPGLSRIAHRQSDEKTYIYQANTKFNPLVYIIDSGINIDHVEFEGRARLGRNFVPWKGNNDNHGHGTWVASIVGGKTYGVCKNAQIVSVKVADGADPVYTTAITLGALEWVVEDTKRQDHLTTLLISMNTTYDKVIDHVVDNAVRSGVVVVASAGNQGLEAKHFSPGSTKSVITVASIDDSFVKPTWSNYGSAVDFFAPGVAIRGAAMNCKYCTQTSTGTSASAPFVAGLSAYFNSIENFKSSEDVKNAIRRQATANRVISQGVGSPNFVVYNGNNADL